MSRVAVIQRPPVVNAGDSVIVEPGENVVAGPLHDELGVLYAELDLERVGVARRSLDIVGHYSRPDIFQLQGNDHRLSPVEFSAARRESDRAHASKTDRG